MTDESDRRYTHYDEYVDDSVGVISGAGERSQRYLHGTVNKWVKPTRLDSEEEEEYLARCKSEQETLSQYQSSFVIVGRRKSRLRTPDSSRIRGTQYRVFLADSVTARQ